MPQKARIFLSSTDYKKLEDVCAQIKRIVEKTGVKMSGPIPLPTKKLIVPSFRPTAGEGTKTWEKWEMRIHKRLIDIDADERTMRQMMRIQIPDNVYIEIELV